MAQSVLFARRPSRLALLELPTEAAAETRFSINIWRNHAIEPLLGLMAPYLAWSAISLVPRIGGYDDAMLFDSWQPADMELLWLDSERYGATGTRQQWLAWLLKRVTALRRLSQAPIVIATWIDDAGVRADLATRLAALPACYLAELSALAEERGVVLIDRRLAGVAGSPLSSAAQVAIAGALACRWLPAALLPPIKAVAVDLDGTLHAGVLAEDGVDGVQLTPGHADLQRFLVTLRRRGVFLALVSRNEATDVAALFAGRRDYPIALADFSVTEISWRDKGEAVADIGRHLRIAADAMLYVDDNPGELAAVRAGNPGIHTILAVADAAQTRDAVAHVPGLWRWTETSTDSLRIADLQANRTRAALAGQAADPADYLASLDTRVKYRFDPTEDLARLVELCAKTNQFNLSLRRSGATELAAWMARTDAAVAGIGLSDRLTDSGLVGIVAAHKQADALMIDELCLSCRALGRNLEDAMVLAPVGAMLRALDCNEVVFELVHGPRNDPARAWLERLLTATAPLPPGKQRVPAERVWQFVAPRGVTIVEPEKIHGQGAD